MKMMVMAMAMAMIVVVMTVIVMTLTMIVTIGEEQGTEFIYTDLLHKRQLGRRYLPAVARIGEYPNFLHNEAQ